MNTDLKKVKNDEKYFFKLMINPVFRKNLSKMLENITLKLRVNYLVSEPNFHTIKFFTEKLLAIKMKKKLKCLTE